MKSALKPGKLDLSCKVNEYGDAGTGDIGVLPSHEIIPYNWLLNKLLNPGYIVKRVTCQAVNIEQRFILSLVGVHSCFELSANTP